MNSDIDSPSGMSSVTVTNLQQDVASVQSMNLIFGGALIILSIVVTGIVCVLGNIPIPYISTYYEPSPLYREGNYSSGTASVPQFPSMHVATTSHP